jgi:uncharacterized protein YjbJ (UPF0337 family)
MADTLFQGAPQTATSYVKSANEQPKWMQDAIYNNVTAAANIANTPYQAYELPRVAQLSPLQQQAYSMVQSQVGDWRPDMDFSSSGMKRYSTLGTADQLRADQGVYLRPGLVDPNLMAGQNYFGQAGQMDIVGAAEPYMQDAQSAMANSLSERALAAANPYLQASSRSSADVVGDYMSPYEEGVMDAIARQGARNLKENLLPAVSDSFIRAGQFGSRGMGEFGSRAVRDTQEAILNKQAELANQGYGQSMSAAQADLARQGQLAGTVGSISGADLSRLLQGGSQYGQLGQTAGGLTANQMQQLAALGQAQTAAGQAQQQYGMQGSQAIQAASAQDYARQMQALMNTAALAQMAQQMGFADTAALESAGTAQQRQQQAQLDAAYNQFAEKRDYLKTQSEWLNNQLRGIAPAVPSTTTQYSTSTGQTYSPSVLSQLAQGYALNKAIG